MFRMPKYCYAEVREFLDREETADNDGEMMKMNIRKMNIRKGGGITIVIFMILLGVGIYYLYGFVTSSPISKATNIALQYFDANGNPLKLSSSIVNGVSGVSYVKIVIDISHSGSVKLYPQSMTISGFGSSSFPSLSVNSSSFLNLGGSYPSQILLDSNGCPYNPSIRSPTYASTSSCFYLNCNYQLFMCPQIIVNGTLPICPQPSYVCQWGGGLSSPQQTNFLPAIDDQPLHFTSGLISVNNLVPLNQNFVIVNTTVSITSIRGDNYQPYTQVGVLTLNISPNIIQPLNLSISSGL